MPSSVPTLLVRFRDDINTPCDASTFRAYFTLWTAPCCWEHGPKGHDKLPFLGEKFEGEEKVLKYWDLIGSVLKGKGSNFDERDLLVREKERQGKARAVWTGDAVWSVAETGKEWKEEVVWLFDLVKEGGDWKIQTWEVWADTLSAYLASQP
ncbi:hypothetical protein Rt10032_c14g5290 [Rhodotorula toruloides]|uniref:SnoaL-like domain-containing protein n=1 Tax=Rhodotorula toruloides TaxID=5286 RepID=A0A511KLL5_RHOTO|nr:hypothetical protein Rt10032_c14g5290 [Rhodotorula toruloides]